MKKTIAPILLILSLVLPIFAQKTTTKPVTKVIFAVLNDGKTLEPLAKVENGKLMQTVSGGDEQAILTAFSKTYYKPKTSYSLIFGGNTAGTVTVIKNDPTAECSTNLATAATKSAKAKLKGFVMALATNISPIKAGSGVRRMPTPAERAEVEKLVIGEFAENKVTARQPLRSHNLTALDVDKDGKIEFVGTYWVTTSATERALLFFIADSGGSGKLAMNFAEFRRVKQEEVMSEEIKALDDGIYHELLLDVLDYNQDGVAEIFTYSQGFEGASFTAYLRKNGKWEQEVETSNYHCGY